MCVFSQIKDRKHIEHNFHSAGVMTKGWDLGGAGLVKNFSVGISNGATSTARSSYSCGIVRYSRANTGFLYQMPD